MNNDALDRPPRTREAVALDEAEKALFRLLVRARAFPDQLVYRAVDECGVKQALDRIKTLKGEKNGGRDTLSDTLAG